jgi:propanediol dehydratase large subunit
MKITEYKLVKEVYLANGKDITLTAEKLGVTTHKVKNVLKFLGVKLPKVLLKRKVPKAPVKSVVRDTTEINVAKLTEILEQFGRTILRVAEEKERLKRNEHIVRLRKKGYSYTEIGERVNLSTQAVRNVLGV